jgi:phosphatidylglycerol:prolipoprotein diacylglycerol transferase
MNGLWSPMKLKFTSGELTGGNVRVSQFLSILIILAAILLIYYRRRIRPRTALYSDPLVSTKAHEQSLSQEEIVQEPEKKVQSDEDEGLLKE